MDHQSQSPTNFAFWFNNIPLIFSNQAFCCIRRLPVVSSIVVGTPACVPHEARAFIKQHHDRFINIISPADPIPSLLQQVARVWYASSLLPDNPFTSSKGELEKLLDEAATVLRSGSVEFAGNKNAIC